MFLEGDHLELGQIEGLIQDAPAGSSLDAQVDRDAARLHLQNCERCRHLFAAYKKLGHDLRALAAVESIPPTSDCPGEQTISELVSGTLDPALVERTNEHVSNCRHCIPIFRQYHAIYFDTANELEKEVLGALPSSHSTVQVELARNLALRSKIRKSPTPRHIQSRILDVMANLPRPAYAVLGAAVALLIVFVAFRASRPRQADLIELQRPSSVNDLLAQAYTSQKTMSARFSGTGSGYPKETRSAESSSFAQAQRHTILVNADYAIQKQLALNPEDPEWLHLQARSDILEGRFSSAISTLNKLVDHNPEDMDFKNDLGLAYLLQGDKDKESPEKAATSYRNSLKQLGPILAAKRLFEPETTVASQNDLVALFNHALVSSRLGATETAEQEWKRYVELDHESLWRSDAEKNKNQPPGPDKSGRSSTELAPELVSSLNSLTANSPTLPRRMEEVQTFVIKNWPQAGSPHVSGLASKAAATSGASTDKWLSDFLVDAHSAKFVEAVHLLREAILASEQSDYATAMQASTAARQRFAEMGNKAGELRAEFEQVYAYHFSNDAQQCARRAELLRRRLRNLDYQWLQTQDEIEAGICFNSLGDYDQAVAALARAIKFAEAAGYGISLCRAQTMNALVIWSRGDRARAWAELFKVGLWCRSNACPTMTTYSVFANMDNFAEDEKSWPLQAAFAKEAVLILSKDPDVLMRVVELNRLAKASMLSGYMQEADNGFASADALLQKAPKTSITDHYIAGIRVDRAKLALDQAHVTVADRYLEQVRPVLQELTDRYILTDYYVTRSRVKESEDDLPEAEICLRWAVGIAESELNAISSERQDGLDCSRERCLSTVGISRTQT